jgi:hypothetical protein
MVEHSTVWGIRGTQLHGFQNEPMVLPPDHMVVISCLDLDPRGLNVVFKILIFMSAEPLTTGYTDLIGLSITVLATCMVHVHEQLPICAHCRMALARGGLTSGMKDLNAALSNNSKNVLNLISDEAFSWPNNTKEIAFK